MSDLLIQNWPEIALAVLFVADLIVSITPGKTDDKVVGYIRLLVNAIANDRDDKKKAE